MKATCTIGAHRVAPGDHVADYAWKAPVLHPKPFKAPCPTKAKPAQDHASQAISYTRTDSQRSAGIVTAGTVWSDGPYPHSVWVSPDLMPRTFAHMTLVMVPRDGSLPFVCLGYADPKAMTTLATTAQAVAA